MKVRSRLVEMELSVVDEMARKKSPRFEIVFFFQQPPRIPRSFSADKRQVGRITTRYVAIIPLSALKLENWKRKEGNFFL